MWAWFVNHSLWILVIAALLLLLFPLLTNRSRSVITGLITEKKREGAAGRINAAFWVAEIIVAIIVLMSFISMTLSQEGKPLLVTGEGIKTWILGHGVRIIVILIVGIAMLAALKK